MDIIITLENNVTADSDAPAPWPLRATADGTIRFGRPDAASLMGFAHVDDMRDVEYLAEIVADIERGTGPDHAIGRTPVYVRPDGTWFTVTSHSVLGLALVA